MSSRDGVQPTPHEDAIFTDLDGIEGVLVDLNTKQYFRLNETACVVWRGLAEGTPLDAIAKEMTEVFDVSYEQARESVDEAVGAFASHRLIRFPR